MVRLLLGLLKGGIVGAAVGFVATRMGLGAGATSWLVYGIVGFLVGVVCGKPPWRQETLWTSIIKGVFGLLVCMGLFWVAQKLLGGMKVPVSLTEALGVADGQALVSVPMVLGPIIGIAFGIIVELDDGGKSAPAAKGKLEKKG